MQLKLDLSTTLGKQSWFNLPQTKMGIVGTWRTLDQYSPRYCPSTTFTAAGTQECNPNAIGYGNGSEWEIRTYIHINIGK